MSKEQVSLATKRFDQNGDGTVSLCDFLAFAGRPYAANDRPLEAKLRRVLLKAEAVREGYPLVEIGLDVLIPLDHVLLSTSCVLILWPCQELTAEAFPKTRIVLHVVRHV